MNERTYQPYSTPSAISILRYYSMFEMLFEPNYTFSGESHNCWEVVCVRDGSICVTADDHIFHLGKGDVIIHKPMEFHKFHVDSQGCTSLFIFSFDLSGKNMKELEDCVIHLTPTQDTALQDILSYLRKEAGMIPQISFDSINHLIQNPKKYQSVSNMIELWLLSLTTTSDVISASTNTAESKVFKIAVQTMEAQITEWSSVKDIALECHVSISYLKKVFSKYAGLGVHQYFLKLKIIHASKLLKSGKSVAEVSDILSFCNANYFSNVFRRETGYSPSVYKKRI